MKNPVTTAAALASLVLAATLSACGGRPPSQEAVAAEFKRAHPDYTAVTVRFDDGDSSGAYFDVHYKKPNDPATHVDHWAYEKGPTDSGNSEAPRP